MLPSLFDIIKDWIANHPQLYKRWWFNDDRQELCSPHTAYHVETDYIIRDLRRHGLYTFILHAADPEFFNKLERELLDRMARYEAFYN